jgi:Insulinase (Peptidase family M16)
MKFKIRQVLNNNQLYRNLLIFEAPFTSVCKCKTITLSNNGLKILLVSDKRTSNSACAVTIQGAGQIADPDDIPGLAHLMEHIILSTKTTSTIVSPTTTSSPAAKNSIILFYIVKIK